MPRPKRSRQLLDQLQGKGKSVGARMEEGGYWGKTRSVNVKREGGGRVTWLGGYRVRIRTARRSAQLKSPLSGNKQKWGGDGDGPNKKRGHINAGKRIAI